jgi:hypothetical protein
MKQHEPHSLALLRKANPVSVEPAAVRSPQARAVFEQIIREPRVSKGTRWGRRSTPRFAGALGLRARFAVGGAAGISAVAAAIIVAVLSGSAAAPAFAGWTARPAVALKQQIPDVTRRCGLADPALVEARGPYTAAVFASTSGGTACVVGPSMSFVGSVGGAQAHDNRFKPNQIGIAVTTGSDTKGHAFILLAGRVGSAVRSVVIHRSNHIDVIASMKDGWYLAWWPASTQATNATVTTTNGAHNVALPTLAKMTPSCSGLIHALGHGQPLSGACGSSQNGSNGPGSAGVPGPPLISGPLARPFGGILLIQVENALKVLVCFHPPHGVNAAMQPDGPTGPCAHAALLTRLPPRYPVQKNLLEVFPKGVWEITLPAGTRSHGALVFLVVAFGTSRYGQARNEITVNW